MLTIYTDGGYSIPKNEGGWGAVITRDGNLIDTHSEKIKNSTSNRAELSAFIYALEILHEEGKGKVLSDSKYVVNGYNGWMYGWKKSGWTTTTGKDVKNADLWKKVYDLALDTIVVEWVRGHNGNEFNELADKLSKG